MTVRWESLHHAYGTAEDVPDQLEALRDPATQSKALGELWGNVYHQGTRWEASHEVVPFLVDLIDDPWVPDRAGILRLLTKIAIGDGRDDELPFDPAAAFATASRADDPELLQRFFEEDDDFSEEEIEILDAYAVKWAADCYHRTATHLDRITSWTTDPDDTLAAEAIALTTWFPPAESTIDAYLAVPATRVPPRASANLALAHTTATDPRIPPLLHNLTASTNDLVAVTAAVAMAYRGIASPLHLAVLTAATDRDPIGDVPGWSRALRGFAHLALRRPA